MGKYLVLLLVVTFTVTLSGCIDQKQSRSEVSSYNSKRLKTIKKQYSSKVTTAEETNYKYSLDDNVLKIDLK